MKFTRYLLTACVGILTLSSVLNAQQPAASASSATVPRLVNFSGKAVDVQGKTISGIAGVTFAIYAEQTGGAPLWLETQNVQADTKGNYTVQLGATKSEGLPLDLFASGAARWLGVAINGGEEQPRILLLSVPYALKAADAETVGGLPASAFVLANKTQGNAAAAPAALTSNPTKSTAPPPANPAVTGTGVAGFVPMWDSTSDIIDSVVSQKNSLIGINTTAPAARLDVNGKSDVRDTLTLFPNGTDPTLAINGTTFKVDQTGKVTFVTGQNFPNTARLNKVNTFTGNQGVIGTLTATGSVGVGTTTPASVLDVFSATNPGGVIARFGSNGTTDSDSTKIYNGNAVTETFLAGCAGCFVPGAQVGDGGVRVLPGKNLVFGDSGASRLILDSSGNASQPHAAGGFIKAMAFVNAMNAPYSILNCFNSNLAGAAATTPPCGINFTESGLGDWLFDFGSKVDDRFLSATLSSNPLGGTDAASCITADAFPTTVEVVTWDCGSSFKPAYFFFFVY